MTGTHNYIIISKMRIEGKEVIDKEYLEILRSESLKLARHKGFSDEIILELKKTPINIIPKEDANGLWYGYASYPDEESSGHIGVLEYNALSDSGNILIKSLIERGAPKLLIYSMKTAIKILPFKKLKHLFDLSGMDHELVGHFGNFLEGNEHGEKAAIKAQIDRFELLK